MKRINIPVTVQQSMNLKKVAAKNGWSMATASRIAVSFFLDNQVEVLEWMKRKDVTIVEM